MALTKTSIDSLRQDGGSLAASMAERILHLPVDQQRAEIKAIIADVSEQQDEAGSDDMMWARMDLQKLQKEI